MDQPFTPTCISTRLRQATRRANAVYDAALEKHGITVAQFALLRAIRRMGKPTLSKLAFETDLDASTLGRNLRVLEKADLVQFQSGNDKRTRVLSLTAHGAEVTEAAGSDWDQTQSDLKSRLGPDGYETLFQLLDALDPDREGSRI